MTYKIECYIETIDSDGNFTFLGSEGYCLEKGDKTYNVLWPNNKPKKNKSKDEKQADDELNSFAECFLFEQKISLCKENSQKKILLLVSAKTSRSKVKLVFVKDSEDNHLTLQSLALI